MEKTPTARPTVGNNHNPAKKNSNNAEFPNKDEAIYCVLCRSSYPRHDVHEHMHSMLHHRELENVLGKDSFHDCQACSESAMGLNEYAQHISTSQHKTKLKIMMLNGVKPISLHNTVGKEMMAYIMGRNKWLKCQEKNEAKSNNYKKLKRKKQEAGQSYAEMVQGASGKNTAVSKVSKQVDKKILKQTQEEGKNIVLKNKENKVFSLQRPPHQNEETLQNESGRLSCLSGGPSGQTWQHPNVRDQFTQWTQQMRYEDNFPVSIYGTKCKLENTQADKLFDKPKVTQEEAAYPPEQKTWPANSQNGHYYEQCCNEADGKFTCDHLPQTGALNFDQKESPGAGQKDSDITNPASENNTAPIRDANVSAMLRHIRRALGVREPCRADREARRQRSDNVTSYAATSVQSSQVSSPTPTSRPGSHTTNETPARPKQTTLKTTREVTQRFEKSSRVAGDSNGTSNNREKESQVAVKSQALLSQQSGGAASSDPNMNITSKVRVARKATRNLLNLSGALSRQSWTDMYKEMKKKKLAKVRAGSSNRFGIKLVKTTERAHSTQAEESDMPLSEGFHWESLPHSPSAEPWTALPPFLQDTTVNNSHTETTQSDVSMQEPLELPCQAQDNDQPVPVVPVKVEPKVEAESGKKKRSGSTASKRKPIVVVLDDISDEPPSVKKKRTKSHTGQDQMDQLLTVSLREEELSHSIQDLDNSLIQARNALQAAYTEVQRLLLLRQQCTAEVDSLRAKRIEILQGMQGGYTTSSAGAAVPPILSPLPSSAPLPASSTQQSLSTNPTSSSTQPCTTTVAPLTLQLKQEMCQIPTVSCNPNTPPINQPVQLFPSNLLPPLLLACPHLASPITAVTPLQHLSADSSKLGKTSPESSTRLLAQPAREGLKECEKTEGLVGKKEEEAEGEMGGNVQAAGSRSSAALDEDKGNESDDSVRMIEPSNIVVIDTDESEKEEAGCNLPVHKEHQKSVSVEFSSSGTKTKRENGVDRPLRTVQPAVKDTSAPPVKDTNAPPVKDTSASPEYIEVSDDEELYLGAFENHTGSVLGLQVYEGRLYTCSGDNTARAYSLTSRKCQLVFEGHTNKVNCLLVASLPNTPACLYTGSSDQTIRCYNTKTSECLEQITLSDRVLCLHVAWNILFAGLADGSVASYDLKTLRELDVLDCHGPRGVSCLGTAQEGARRVLLVGSYDSTISVRDAKSGLLLRSLGGHTKTVLCMKVVNDLVFSGSSDMSVHAYNIHTGELLRIYKAHGHAVTSIVILGKVMVTACLDQLVRVYELQSQDRLQVYGGHSDMVMCMAVHKNVIYTGCYDGSVQALEFNLLKNHRCWWQNCSLVFGMAEHLVQHLVRDHSNPNLQTVKCRWRSCSSFFSTQQSVRQELPEHMKSHVQKDSEVQPGPSL